jgi:integrase
VRLGEAGHGSWYFSLELPRRAGGPRRRVRRGGFASQQAAAAARGRLSVPGPAGRVLTVGEWLELWLATRAMVRDSTRSAYRGHIRLHLRPRLGGILLAELHVGHLERVFTGLLRGGMTAATARRVHATLRSALNDAVRERLIPDHPARFVRLPRGRRPHAVVWTRRRVRAWERSRVRPAVAVWTPQQAARFLESVTGHRLYALFRLMATSGLRRGETLGLRWPDVDLAGRAVHVSGQLQRIGGRLAWCPPKTETSVRAVALDRTTVAALRRHRRSQDAQAQARGMAGSGYVFTAADGRPLSPDVVSRTFSRLAAQAGLPPVRLHDLRHGAASLALLAGTDLKVIADQLGHSSIVLTADTYLSVAAELGLASAAATARLIRRAGQRPPGGGQTRRPSARPMAIIA